MIWSFPDIIEDSLENKQIIYILYHTEQKEFYILSKKIMFFILC